MKKIQLITFMIVCVLFGFGLSETNKKPNIIFIVADDMGFNDVGFHGSNEIPTPNIDALAYNGVILNSHYTQALCTPSRSAFLTGKYPIHLGMQHLVILEPEPWGLPLNESLLPEYLKRNGYNTHAVGKWHLGFFKKEYTPTYRGFDTHYGYWQGLQDYYDHTVHASYTSEHGYDMRRNMSIDWSAKGKYSTTLFTEEAVNLIKHHNTDNPMFMYLAHLAPHTGNDNDPLQAPDEEIAKFSHIADPERRIYAAMVSLLDKSVGSVIQALREKHMLENSIIIFLSDNGAQTFGMHANHGSNYPLRGMKNSPWEGAMRGVAAIWSPLIKKSQRIENNLMHISDWLPTLYTAVGLNKDELPKDIDGVDQWQMISEGNGRNPRKEMVYNIDDIYNYGALRQGDWKYVYGSPSQGTKDSWYGSSGRQSEYYYDINKVLTSKVNSALSGLITYQQIKEKNTNQDDNDNNFTVNLLNRTIIETLRNLAEINCSKYDNIDIPVDNHCDPLQSPCLFNIKDDPCERINLAQQRPIIVMNMEQSLSRWRKTAVPPRNTPRDPKADPRRFNNTWTNWQDYDDDFVIKTKIYYNALSPLTIVLISIACVAFTVIIVILTVITMKSIQEKNDSKQYDTTCLDEEIVDTKHGRTSKIFEEREMQARDSIKHAFRTVE